MDTPGLRNRHRSRLPGKLGATGRLLAMRNISIKGCDDKGTYTLCRQDDGAWQFVSEHEMTGWGDNEEAGSVC